MNDPEAAVSERERRQDPEPVNWHGEVPFLGESLPCGAPDAAARDAEVMAFDDWRVLYAVDAEGRLVFV